MKLYATVKKFSEDAPELFTAFKAYADATRTGNYGSVSKSDQEKVINKLFSEELTRRSGLTVEQFGDMAHFATSRTVKEFADAMVDTMVDMVLPESALASVGAIADFKFAGFGDALKFDIKNNSLFTVSRAGRRQRTTPAQKQGETTVTIVAENHQATVYLSLFDVLTDRQSIAEYIMKVIKSFEYEMVYDIWDAFYGAFEASTFPAELKESAYDEKKLITLCQKVTAWNNGKKAVIMGTSVALKDLLPSNASTRILLGDEYNTIGYMYKFNNYDVIEMAQIPDVTSATYGLKLKDDKLFVVSPAMDKLVKVGVEGSTITRTSDAFDNANLAIEGVTTKAWGVEVVTNAVAGCMTV